MTKKQRDVLIRQIGILEGLSWRAGDIADALDLVATELLQLLQEVDGDGK